MIILIKTLKNNTMVIKVDKEGREAIQKLVDVTLKTGGLQVLQGVNAILASVSMIQEGLKNDANQDPNMKISHKESEPSKIKQEKE